MKEVKNSEKHSGGKMKLEGVFEKGYGMFAKAVMVDNELSLQSKGIYAYICSYSGAGASIYPRRETILKDLNLSKNGYYKHYKALIDHGYIRVDKKKGSLNKNIYVIVNNPEKLKNTSLPVVSENILSINGIYRHGYGFIPKSIMTDRSITVKAKGLLAYFYILASSGACIFPTERNIIFNLGISTTAYNTALNQLIKAGYITIKKEKKNGKFSVTLNTTLGSINPPAKVEKAKTQNEDNDKTRINTELSFGLQNDDIAKDHIKEEKSSAIQNEDIERTRKLQNKDIENEDNNNSTCVNSNISLRAIYQSGKCVDEKILPGKVMNKLQEDIFYVHEHGLPVLPKINAGAKFTIIHAIKELAILDEILEDNEDPVFRHSYIMAVSCLCEMATESREKIYRDTSVAAWQVTELINKCLEYDCDYGKTIHNFLHDFIINYHMAKEIFNIKNPAAYMKGMLWNSLSVYAAY